MGSKRGKINALTNTKRAIDCQTDKIFSSLGLNPNGFPLVIEEFIGNSKNSSAKKDIPIRLQFIQSMGFAPVIIISQVRLIRNKLEHYCKEPSNDDVYSAIELAELFILSTDNKLKSLWDFIITDKKKKDDGDGHLWDTVYVTYDDSNHLFDVKGYIGKHEKKEIKIYNTMIEFYYLLKIATSFDYIEDVQEAMIDFIKCIEHPIPASNIHVEMDYG